jgi:hypothetical protein
LSVPHQRIGGLAVHARHNSLEIAARARTGQEAALNARLLAEIDTRDPGLPQEERQRRLGFARREHYARLAYASAKARAARKGGQNAS